MDFVDVFSIWQKLCLYFTNLALEVLQYIQRDWDFMTDDKCIPLQISLKLLDSSSLGLASRYNQFRDTHQQLQNALKAIVNGR